MKTIAPVIMIALLFLSCGESNQTNGDASSFRNTVDIQLNAIRTKDIEKLEPIVAESVSMIDPAGKKIDSKKLFIAFHKSWFAQTDWTWEGKILRTETSDSLGYALIQFQYVQKDTAGSALFQDHVYLVLIFKNSAKGWQLIHDQTTEIQELNKAVLKN